jgi:hypothetical protein
VFSNVNIEPTLINTTTDAREFLLANDLDASVVSEEMDGKFLSAFIRATKPAGATITSRFYSVLRF